MPNLQRNLQRYNDSEHGERVLSGEHPTGKRRPTLHDTQLSGHGHHVALLLRILGTPGRCVNAPATVRRSEQPRWLTPASRTPVPRQQARVVTDDDATVVHRAKHDAPASLLLPQRATAVSPLVVALSCVAESDAILWYLAEGTPYLPEVKLERARVLQWMFFERYSHEPYVATPRFILKHLPKDSPPTQRTPGVPRTGAGCSRRNERSPRSTSVFRGQALFDRACRSLCLHTRGTRGAAGSCAFSECERLDRQSGRPTRIRSAFTQAGVAVGR